MAVLVYEDIFTTLKLSVLNFLLLDLCQLPTCLQTSSIDSIGKLACLSDLAEEPTWTQMERSVSLRVFKMKCPFVQSVQDQESLVIEAVT